VVSSPPSDALRGSGTSDEYDNCSSATAGRRLRTLVAARCSALLQLRPRLVGVGVARVFPRRKLVAALAAWCWSAVSCPTSDLSQLRRARPSLDSDSLATLIYADVNSRMDYCNSVLAGGPRTVTDKSQRVLNAAARVITGTRKFDRSLVQILHDQLRWLDVPDWVLFKLAVIVHRCLNGRAPPYLSEHCIPIPSGDTRRHLRSANRHLLAVPRFRLNNYGRQAFSVAGPMAWNSLPDFIRDPTSSTACFRRLLKTFLFARYWCIQRIRGSNDYALYKSTHSLT